jgi:hypothetical protein
MTIRPLAVGAALLLAACASAHHGRRFLFVTEFRMPHPGQIFGIVDLSASRFRGGSNSMELEPGLLFALGDRSRMAFELHSHIDKDGAEPWDYEATGFEFRSRIGAEKNGWGFAVGGEVEAPAHRGPTPVTAEMIAGHEDMNGVWAFNLFANNEEGLAKRTAWIYRAGWSPTLPGSIGWSLEAQGEVARDSAHEIALGAAMSFGENRLLKLGIGKGVGPGAADWILHAGLVVRLR